MNRVNSKGSISFRVTVRAPRRSAQSEGKDAGARHPREALAFVCNG